MPDITMCKGIRKDGWVCPLKMDCYRFTAKPNELRQSYFESAPVEVLGHGVNKCEYIWKREALPRTIAQRRGSSYHRIRPEPKGL